MTQIRAAADHEWDEIWRACDYATFFHSRSWSEAWGTYSRGTLRPAPMLVEFSDGKRALLPLSCRRAFGGLVKRYVSSPARTYGGWISADVLEFEHARLLIETLRGFNNLVWRVNPYDPLQSPEVGVTKIDSTEVLELHGDFAALHKMWSKGPTAPRLRQVKQASKFGVTVRLAAGPSDWDEYYDVYVDSLRRWGDSATSRYRRQLFEELSRTDSSNVRLWLACHEGRVIAGALCCYAKTHVSYWHGAALENSLHLRPSALLMFECIKHACEAGYRWFDFNPSGGHEGVKAFKRSFSTRELSCPVVTQTGVLASAITALTDLMVRARRPALSRRNGV